MGLVKKLELSSGVLLPKAYYRISTVGGDKTNQLLTLCLYASQTAYAEGKDCLEQRYHSFEPSVADGSDNFIKQGYEYVKSLPEFSDAVNI